MNQWFSQHFTRKKTNEHILVSYWRDAGVFYSAYTPGNEESNIVPTFHASHGLQRSQTANRKTFMMVLVMT